MTQEDFPIAFAEEIKHTNSKQYDEWLKDSSEFPILNPIATNDLNLTSGKWEFLQRKEIIEEEGYHELVPVEEDDDWSKLNTSFENEQLYSEAIEKNTADMQPQKMTIKPLWTDQTNKEVTIMEDDGDDNYEDDLGAELIDDVKSSRRRANRYSDRRRIHDLKTVETHFKGIYSAATGAQPMSESTIGSRASRHRSDKANALVLCTKYMHNMKKRSFKYLDSRNRKPAASLTENSEYSVHSDVTVKL